MRPRGVFSLGFQDLAELNRRHWDCEQTWDVIMGQVWGRAKRREAGQEVLAITQDRGWGPGSRAGSWRDAVRSQIR